MLSCEKINAYRNMWLMISFDLPTSTKKERKLAQMFRKRLLNDGFHMFQFSIYIRNCPSRENADVHVKRIQSNIPDVGRVAIIRITDKQFENIELFYGKKPDNRPPIVQQLELF